MKLTEFPPGSLPPHLEKLAEANIRFVDLVNVAIKAHLKLAKSKEAAAAVAASLLIEEAVDLFVVAGETKNAERLRALSDEFIADLLQPPDGNLQSTTPGGPNAA